jgi:omega-6 fatty acid desaturase (delta-12 desaturase)
MTVAPGASVPMSWNAILRPYMKPSVALGALQIVTTIAPLVGLWIAMLAFVDVAYPVTLVLSVPTALFLVRLFMIQHDCGHGAFFRSPIANDVLGNILGILTLVPYAYWRRTHAIHHGTSGNLDRRRFGEIQTLPIEEYRARSRAGRLVYRLYRDPLVLLLLGPIYQFILKHRFPWNIPLSWTREWASVLFTNLGIAALYVALATWIGVGRFLAIQIPIVMISGTVGIFLFYVQHQFEGAYWRRNEDWNYFEAGLEGSSRFALPRVLQWFTANIGFHHVHHLCSKIPNYRLERCYKECPALHAAPCLTLKNCWKCLRLALWDEERERLVGFRDVR